MREVVLYTKAGCHLCDVVKEQILAMRPRAQFAFREVDITGDAELFEEHRFDIPVVEIDGRRAFKHRVDPALLLEQLA